MLRLGHYALPNLAGTIRRSTCRVRGHEAQCIYNGTYQLALVSLSGWDKLETLDTNGLNPVRPASTILNVSALPSSGVAYATLLLWKKSGTPRTEAELTPVRQLVAPAAGTTVELADGRRKQLNYK